MGKERKSERPEKTETHEEETCLMMVCVMKKSVPRIRTVKPKERINVTPEKSCSITEKATTACVTSGNIMKLYVNLMPVLASTKEPVEEEEGEKEVNSCATGKEPENIRKKEPSVIKSAEQTLKTRDTYTALSLKKATETKQLPSGSALPPLTQPKPALESCVIQENRMCFTPLPPISVCEQPTTFCSNITTKGSDDGDGRLWIDNPLLSRSRSAEFCLPVISLSSLDALLQTVTQKLARKRRGPDDGPWGRVHSDQLIVAANERQLREQMEHNDRCREEGHHAAATAASVPGHSVKSQMNLPPLSPPTLILTMTKKTN